MVQIPSQQLPANPKTDGMNWKVLITGIVIGVMIVLIAVIGTVLYKNAVKEEPIQKVSTATQKTATPSAKTSTESAQKSATASLTNTYKDTFYSISFNYPSNWEEKTKSGVETCEPSVGPKNVEESGISICEFGQSSAEMIAGLADKSNVSLKKNLTISSKNVIRQVVTEDGKDKVFAYIDGVTLNNQTGTITIIGWPEGSGLSTLDFVELFNNVLSTFKFTQ